jgi:hypothetical protein
MKIAEEKLSIFIGRDCGAFKRNPSRKLYFV